MVRIAGVQFGGHRDKAVNIATATRLIREAARRGAQIICPPGLLNTDPLPPLLAQLHHEEFLRSNTPTAARTHA